VQDLVLEGRDGLMMCMLHILISCLRKAGEKNPGPKANPERKRGERRGVRESFEKRDVRMNFYTSFVYIVTGRLNRTKKGGGKGEGEGGRRKETAGGGERSKSVLDLTNKGTVRKR